MIASSASVPKSNRAYIEFIVDEYPTIPYNGEHLLRFRSEVSGSLNAVAKQYIKGV